jgi:hypothetical protein
VRPEGLLIKNKNKYGPHYYYCYYYLIAIGLTPGGSSLHLLTNSTQNSEDGTHITITMSEKHQKRKNNNYKEKIWKQIGKCGPCPVLASYTLAFALQLRKKIGKPQLG